MIAVELLKFVEVVGQISFGLVLQGEHSHRGQRLLPVMSQKLQPNSADVLFGQIIYRM